MRRHVYPDVVGQQKLVTLRESNTARDAARQMNDQHISSVLVTEDGQLKGIVTVRDITRRVVGDGKNPDTATLAEIMTPAPKCVAAEATPTVALRMMQEGGFRHLPVEQQGRVVAVAVRSDFNPEEETCLQFEEQLWEHIR